MHLALHGWEPTFFVQAGDSFASAERAPESLFILRNSSGYDGVFFYRLALDPFSTQPESNGIRFDSGAYRQQRILYPLLAGILAGWNPALAPWTLILVNWIAIVAIAWLGVRLAETAGVDGHWGAVFPLWPGLFLSLLRDLAEPTAIVLMMTGMLLVRRHRFAAASAALALAALARETTLLFPIAWMLFELTRRLRRQDEPRSWEPLLCAFLPLLVYGFWTLVLTLRWSTHPIMAGTGNVGIPLLGFVQLALEQLPPKRLGSVQTLFEQLCLLGFCISTARFLASSSALSHEKLAWGLALALGASATRFIWVESWSYLRVLSEFYMFGSLVLLSAPCLPKALSFGPIAAVWCFSFFYNTQLLQLLLRGSVPFS